MKIAILTSSRADYGIYLPLLKRLRMDPFFDVRVIAFGTHLSGSHGHTIDVITSDGFTIDHTVEHGDGDDSSFGVSKNMAAVSLKFSELWEKEKDNYDLVFCLGDRYEMFAAVSASVPFNIKLAHIHGGETTLGAIDNKFRHCLSIFSKLHFVATRLYAKKVREITGDSSNIHVVGALSLDNLKDLKLLSKDQFREKYKIDLSKPSILVTFHPDTVNPEKNEEHARQLVKALSAFNNYIIIITMPNADTMGNAMRKVYKQFAIAHSNVSLIENFGTVGYFSCMKYCSIIAGNSSSGIIEAASFKKYVVNIGNRQAGRLISKNIFHSKEDANSITQALHKALAAGAFRGTNVYLKRGSANEIINVLKNTNVREL